MRDRSAYSDNLLQALPARTFPVEVRPAAPLLYDMRPSVRSTPPLVQWTKNSQAFLPSVSHSRVGCIPDMMQSGYSSLNSQARSARAVSETLCCSIVGTLVGTIVGRWDWFGCPQSHHGSNPPRRGASIARYQS